MTIPGNLSFNLFLSLCIILYYVIDTDEVDI